MAQLLNTQEKLTVRGVMNFKNIILTAVKKVVRVRFAKIYWIDFIEKV